MAGCRPSTCPCGRRHPGLCHPHFAYHGPASSTGGSRMVTIVNGPIARRNRHELRQQRVRSGQERHATIGRAVRLTRMNVMNTRPGFLDRANLAIRQYSFCFAENRVDHPWEPLPSSAATARSKRRHRVRVE